MRAKIRFFFQICKFLLKYAIKIARTRLEFLLYSLLFILIGLMLVSFFLVWKWFDARDRLKVVREVTREQTIHAIRHAHNKCRWLLYISLLLAIAYVPIPFLLQDFYGTLAYPAVVILADMLILIGLRSRRKAYMASIDEYVNENEEHVREAAAAREQQREQWKREAATLNPQAEALLYAQGIVIPFSEIMEVRMGRKDLKLVTSDSTYPFVTLDFGALPINPETGNKYMDEIATEIQKLIP